MRPISVCIPVAVTTAMPATVSRRRAAENHVVAVAQVRFRQDAASMSFETGRLSPVNAASAICNAVE